MKQSGRCQCGKVSYSFDKEKVISAHHCYCKDCQRSTGCGKATIIYVASKNLKIKGDIKYFDKKGTTGMTIRRGFLSKLWVGGNELRQTTTPSKIYKSWDS